MQIAWMRNLFERQQALGLVGSLAGLDLRLLLQRRAVAGQGRLALAVYHLVQPRLSRSTIE